MVHGIREVVGVDVVVGDDVVVEQNSSSDLSGILQSYSPSQTYSIGIHLPSIVHLNSVSSHVAETI